MIERVDVRELPIYEILLRCLKALVVDYKDFWFSSIFSLIPVFCSIKADLWIKLKGFIHGRRLPQGLADEALIDIFLLMVFDMVIFKMSYPTQVDDKIVRVAVILICRT